MDVKERKKAVGKLNTTTWGVIWSNQHGTTDYQTNVEKYTHIFCNRDGGKMKEEVHIPYCNNNRAQLSAERRRILIAIVHTKRGRAKPSTDRLRVLQLWRGCRSTDRLDRTIASRRSQQSSIVKVDRGEFGCDLGAASTARTPRCVDDDRRRRRCSVAIESVRCRRGCESTQRCHRC
jgi:hypothetical protein